jgi:DNA polymerase III epsilon subunit-like protein
VDTETTGLDPGKNFAFQISYLIEENGAVLSQSTLELRPDEYKTFKFDKKAEAVHGYSRKKIISMPPESAVFPGLLAELKLRGKGRLTIAGYNVDFDIRFLRALFGRGAGRDIFDKYFDHTPSTAAAPLLARLSRICEFRRDWFLRKAVNCGP